MSLSALEQLLGLVEKTKIAVETGRAFENADNFREFASDLGAIVAGVAVGVIAEQVLRLRYLGTPLQRLGAALRGKKEEIAATSALTGVVVGATVTKALLQTRDSGIVTNIVEAVDDFFGGALRAVLLRDPLVLDLDGDGLETVGSAQSNVTFDHDGDGVRTGTGWVLGDDGFLVWDRNGNGLIDSGRELFGDSTLKSNGQLAVDGFNALADLDANADGKVDALDPNFASLRVCGGMLTRTATHSPRNS